MVFFTLRAAFPVAAAEPSQVAALSREWLEIKTLLLKAPAEADPPAETAAPADMAEAALLLDSFGGSLAHFFASPVGRLYPAQPLDSVLRGTVFTADTAQLAAALQAAAEEGDRGRALSLAADMDALETLSPLPRLVILDISLGRENGLALPAEIDKICKRRGEQRPAILVCSMYADPFLARSALEGGADGYISKSVDMDELLAAIGTILGGGNYIDKNLAERSRNTVWGELTRREREILLLLKRSLNNREIADAMFISVRTVENHLAHIYLKTGAASRRDLLEM